MEDVNWNIMGDNRIVKKFIVPIGREKKWWEFWKKHKDQEFIW